jgi:hypothetical protein
MKTMLVSVFALANLLSVHENPAAYERLTSTGGSCVDCPEGAQIEGEPPCPPSDYDTFNGGCDTGAFTSVTCGTICGTGGYWSGPGGWNQMEQDWYSLSVGAGTFTCTLVCDDPGYGPEGILAIHTGNCPGSYLAADAGLCCYSPPSLTFDGPGTFYIVASLDAFVGTGCTYPYVLTITGPGIPPCVPTASNATTWGSLKRLYR